MIPYNNESETFRHFLPKMINFFQIVRNFEMEWNHEPMQITNRILNTLGSPLQLKLIDR